MGLVVSVVAMLGLFIAVSPAYAASTCDVTAGVMTIDIASGGTVTVGVNVGGAKFVVTGVSSTDATECNVTFATITGGVHVNGAAGNETLVLDMTNGDYDGFDTFVIDLSTGSSDLLSVLGTSTGDTLTFGAGTATLDGSDATLAGVDKVSVDSNGGADTIDGGTLDVPMTIRGGTGADSITGGVDDDLMFGGSGSDDFFDSTGYDTVSYADHGGGVTVTIDDLANDGFVAEDDNVGVGIEKLVGSAFSDSLTGSTGDDEIHGGTGNDTIRGLAGADLVFGESGRDTVSGDGGDDFVTGGPWADRVFGGSGADTTRRGSRGPADPITATGRTQRAPIGAPLLLADGLLIEIATNGSTV